MSSTEVDNPKPVYTEIIHPHQCMGVKLFHVYTSIFVSIVLLTCYPVGTDGHLWFYFAINELEHPFHIFSRCLSNLFGEAKRLVHFLLSFPY